jgi:hypothetical protein
VNEAEPAKTAALRIMEAFTAIPEEDETYAEESKTSVKEEKKEPFRPLFESQHCETFIKTHLPAIMGKEGSAMLFKVKKTLMPCLLAVGNHISYESWIKHVYETFKKFTADPIWGVRKVCLEVMPQILNKLLNTEIERVSACMDFLSSSLQDESKWVRYKAYE